MIFNDSSRTLMCHSYPSLFSKTNKCFAFHIFIKFVNWKYHFLFQTCKPGIRDFFKLHRGINVNKKQNSSLHHINKERSSRHESTAKLIRATMFGEVFVNLTQQCFIPLPGAGNNVDVISKSRLQNSPKYKGIHHGRKKKCFHKIHIWTQLTNAVLQEKGMCNLSLLWNELNAFFGKKLGIAKKEQDPPHWVVMQARLNSQCQCRVQTSVLEGHSMTISILSALIWGLRP